MKGLQIFKPGKRTASDGRVITFTEADVRATAQAYSPDVHEAPLVIGHPKSNAPAYGWTKALTFAEGTLLAEPHQVNADFAELVNSGALKKISASFYMPDSKDNPVPGVYYLRHVGFLGAQPPSVKGLKSAEFAEADDGVVEFMDWSKRDIATLFRGVRDLLIEKFGLETADKAIPEYAVSSIQDDAATTNNPTSSFSETATDMDKDKLETQRREQEAKAEEQRKKDLEFSEREKNLKATEAATRRTAITAEVAELVKAGKVLPKDSAGLVAFMESLPEGTTIEFGEADKKVTTPTIDFLRSFLKGLPKAVEFTERGAGGENAGGDMTATEIATKATAYVDLEEKAGRTVSFADAVDHVTKDTAAQ